MMEEEEEFLNLEYGQYNKTVQHVNCYFSTVTMNTEMPASHVQPVQ
jgi:hypothetical protein